MAAKKFRGEIDRPRGKRGGTRPEGGTPLKVLHNRAIRRGRSLLEHRLLGYYPTTQAAEAVLRGEEPEMFGFFDFRGGFHAA
jgi:hypothetical protein